MQYKVQGIAQSSAGHDKGKLYIVLEKDGTSALLADGKGRKLSRPKKKNTKHVIFLPDCETDAVSGKISEQMTDAALRRALSAVRERRRHAENDQGGT